MANDNEQNDLPDDEQDQGLSNEHDGGFTEDQLRKFHELS